LFQPCSTSLHNGWKEAPADLRETAGALPAFRGKGGGADAGMLINTPAEINHD